MGAVPDQRFLRDNHTELRAQISAFRLDLFEVTVGRFRQFVVSSVGWRPAVGAGAHFAYPESGWDPSWDDLVLPAGSNGPAPSLADDPLLAGYTVWTAAPGPSEQAPMNIATAYEAMAFCIWDGGRLPTVAENEAAYVGGDEQRPRPWGTAECDAQHATTGQTRPVGSAPLGIGRWGHFDLAGSAPETSLDSEDGDVPRECDDCIQNLDTRMVGSYRETCSEGGFTYFTAQPRRNEVRGFRCIYEGPGPADAGP